MGASANPSGNNQVGSPEKKKGLSSSSVAKNGVAVNSVNNDGNSAATVDNLQTINALKHNPGISNDWTPEEDILLEELLKKYSKEPTIVRYANIAIELKNKTIRDISMRRRWMSKKENGKRRKEDHSSRKSKDRKKEKAMDSSAKSSSHLNVNDASYAPPTLLLDDGGISCKDIGGVSGDLLEQNVQLLNQVSSNFAAFQLHDNTSMLSKARDNILAIMNDLNDMPETMKQMPPLPVKMNEEIANLILPRPPEVMIDLGTAEQ